MKHSTPHSRRRLVAVVAAAVAALLVPTSVPVAASTAAAEGPVTVVHSPGAQDRLASVRTYADLMALPSVDSGARPVSRAPRERRLGDYCPRNRCVDVRVPTPRGVRVSDNRVRVVLPVGYHQRARARTRYPVIYFWNGAKSDYKSWTYKSEILEMSRRWQAILVMPSGGEGAQAGMMTDWHDGSYQWETFHTKVVVPFVDRRFRTMRGARAMLGPSMGGIGVFTYAAHNPGLFKAVLSVSGVVDTRTLMAQAIDPQLAEALGVEPPYLKRIWGDPVLDRANWRRHNPAELAPRLRGTEVFITSGTGYVDQGLDDYIHSGTFERIIWDSHRTFLAALTAAGVPYTARVAQGGIHDYPYFNNPLRWGIPKLIAAARRR